MRCKHENGSADIALFVDSASLLIRFAAFKRDRVTTNRAPRNELVHRVGE
jgi:hypothetical protein